MINGVGPLSTDFLVSLKSLMNPKYSNENIIIPGIHLRS